MIIRGIVEKDHKAVAELITKAFGQPDEAALVDRLRAGGHMALELVAEQNGRVLGHVALSRMDTPARWLALAPVSVTPKQQRKGIGAALCQTALAYANAPVVVLGDPGYYAAFGFDFAQGAKITSAFPVEYTGVYLPEGTELPEAVDLTYAAPFMG